MRGLLYRCAIGLKDFGERHRFGVFIQAGLNLKSLL